MCPLPNLTKLDPLAADRLFSGTGPLEGWISCSVNGKALVMEARRRRGCCFSRSQFLWTDLAGTPSTGRFKYSMKLDRSFSKNMRFAKRIDESLFVRMETILSSEINRKPFDRTGLVGDPAKGAWVPSYLVNGACLMVFDAHWNFSVLLRKWHTYVQMGGLFFQALLHNAVMPKNQWKQWIPTVSRYQTAWGTYAETSCYTLS